MSEEFFEEFFWERKALHIPDGIWRPFPRFAGGGDTSLSCSADFLISKALKAYNTFSVGEVIFYSVPDKLLYTIRKVSQ